MLEQTYSWCENTRVPSVQKPLVLLLILAILAIFPASFASQELVKNGGFESGKFSDWSTINSAVRTSSTTGTWYEPAHSGKYSARIGSETTEGTISQTIIIPPKSDGEFTAWYRVEKGASLTIFLKRGDGSIIQQWSVTSIASWTFITYHLDVGYAGQSVIVEFDGVGSVQPVVLQGWCYDAAGREYPCSYTSYDYYYPYVDDVSLISSVVAYESSVTISGLSAGLSTKVLVDGTQVAQLTEGQTRSFAFKVGESHRLSVETYVYEDNGTRYYCPSDAAIVDSDGSITFSYRPQFYLSVVSTYGTVSGSGWYDEGSKVSVSLNPDWVPMQGLMGMLGAKYVFQKWTADALGSSTTLQFVMDKPKSVSAIWVPDYSIFSVAIVVLVAGVASVFWILIRKHRKVGKRGTEIFLEERPWVELEKTLIETPQKEKEKTEIFKEKEESENKKE